MTLLLPIGFTLGLVAIAIALACLIIDWLTEGGR